MEENYTLITSLVEKLSGIFYDDPSKSTGTFLKPMDSRETLKSVLLESHPVLAFACALPTGHYSEGDYSNPNQKQGAAVERLGTVLSGLSLAGTIIQNLSDGHVGVVYLNYRKDRGTLISWNLVLTTLDPISGHSTARQVFF